jgi:hypothetical protein
VSIVANAVKKLEKSAYISRSPTYLPLFYGIPLYFLCFFCDFCIFYVFFATSVFSMLGVLCAASLALAALEGKWGPCDDMGEQYSTFTMCL